ncbi:MAG: hypothetical protein JOY66_23280 [Acetobacteraceae bacterium]|nr:hypothetical protein [Acetobacteraceae bacterium]
MAGRTGEGFESHWDSGWFRHKALQCRQMASCVADATVRATLEEMAADFDTQGDIAEEAAKSVPRHKRADGAGVGDSPR